MRRARSNDEARQRPMRTAWARIIAALVDRADRAGVAREGLLHEAGLREADLSDPDARISIEAFYALLEAIVDRSGDPFAVARLTSELDLESFDALAFAVMTSPTLRAGLGTMLRFQRVFLDGERYELEEDGEWARIVQHPWGPRRPAHALMAEMFAVDVCMNGPAVAGGPFDRPRVLFAHSPRADVRALRDILGRIEPEYDQPRNEVWLRTSDLDRRVAPPSQSAICAYFVRRLEERIAALPRMNVAGAIRDALMRAPRVEPSMESLARGLRMSARTLQRRLQNEGTSLRLLVDEARRARALPLLARGFSIAEIADLLGYAEPSAFHRAFRRWTARTPESFR